ncbi:MAG: sigma-54 dependent transcriptional regulator [Proteobacteria bacterium]|nr:sigma-54 dependent transcriptional regulator [Pseudomonadota bacterium]
MAELILLIDDDESLRRVTEYNLTSDGLKVITAASGKEGLDKFKVASPDLLITDVKLGDMSGLDVLEQVKKDSPDTPVIVITAFGSIEMAVSAMQHGAFNFITKPFDRDTLRLSCRKALEFGALRSRNRLLAEEVNRLTGTEGMDTANSAMAELLSTAIRAANSEASVLISGDSGTGKEVLARLIHQNSPRRKGPMVAVNCAAIPENLIESELFGHVKGAFTGAVANRKGRFQTASGGTLFLDEIGELKMDMQAKLLRAVQELVIESVGSDRPEKVDVRIISASNKDLLAGIGKGEFREDLYYRLGVIPLHIPPLRDRKEDIPSLANHFLKKAGAPPDVVFTREAMAALMHYNWPGNIRELQNIVERSFILRKGQVIDARDLHLQTVVNNGLTIPDIPDEGLSLEEVEKGLIRKALDKAAGNRSEAARLLKMPRHVLIYRLEKFGL